MVLDEARVRETCADRDDLSILIFVGFGKGYEVAINEEGHAQKHCSGRVAHLGHERAIPVELDKEVEDLQGASEKD